MKREKRGGHFGESRPPAFHILEANLNKLCPNRDRGTSQKIHIFALYEKEKIEKMCDNRGNLNFLRGFCPVGGGRVENFKSSPFQKGEIVK